MSEKSDRQRLRIAIVGPCSSGKTVLAKALRDNGFDVRQPAQEHSYVADMWRRMVHPDVLIYLDVDYANARARRPYIDGGAQRLAQQHERLRHARQHCDFYLDTSGLTPRQIRKEVIDFLQTFAGVSNR